MPKASRILQLLIQVLNFFKFVIISNLVSLDTLSLDWLQLVDKLTSEAHVAIVADANVRWLRVHCKSTWK